MISMRSRFHVAVAAFAIGIVFVPPTHAAEASNDHDEKIRQEILGQAEREKKEARNGDSGIFANMIAEDYAEFNPFFPFLLDAPKSVSVELEKAWDAFDKLPRTDRSHTIQKIQVYGDVALLTYTSISKGTVVGPGFMNQAKFLIVYVKRNGVWVLAFTHDGRRTGPDGLPID